MKLTFDIFQEPEASGVWISHCVELDIVSQHTRPELAIEAIAEAARMTLQHEMKRCGLSCAEAFDAIAKEVAERRPIAASAHGGLDNKIERACHEWKALGNPPANPTTLGDVWIGNTKPTPELLKRFVTTEQQAFTDGLDEIQRLRAEVRELRVELSHRPRSIATCKNAYGRLTEAWSRSIRSPWLTRTTRRGSGPRTSGSVRSLRRRPSVFSALSSERRARGGSRRHRSQRCSSTTWLAASSWSQRMDVPVDGDMNHHARDRKTLWPPHREFGDHGDHDDQRHHHRGELGTAASRTTTATTAF